MHYILIDYENVQPADLAGLDAEQAFVLVFTGAQQKVGIALIEAVQALGERGRFIRIAGSGPNALDFHIACYLGQWMVRDPQATFLIVSRDTGFDPLIAHLNAGGVRVKRLSVDPPAKKAANKATKKAAQPAAKKAAKKAVKKAAKSATQPQPQPQPATKQTAVVKAAAKATPAANTTKGDADRIVNGLKGMQKNLPASEASLRRMAATWLASKDVARMDNAISELSKRRVIDLTEPKIRYALPK